MQEEYKFEKSLRRRLEDAGMEPAWSNWDAIQTKLDASHRPAKKRVAFFWIFGLFLLSGSAFFFFYPSSQSEIKSHSESKVNNAPIQNVMGQKIAAKAIQLPTKATSNSNLPFLAHQRASFITLTRQNDHLHDANNSATTTPMASGPIILPINDAEAPLNSELPLLIPEEEPQALSWSRNVFLTFPPLHSFAPWPNKIHPQNIETHWTIVAGGHLLRSFRVLSPSNNASVSQQKALALRSQIELPGTGFTGGIELKRNILPWLQIGSGILITHYAEYLAYKRNDGFRVAHYEPIVDIDQEFRNQNMGNDRVFRYVTDSIYAPQKSDTGIYGATNSYYFREIPLSFTLIKEKENWEWLAVAGLSYQHLNVIDVQMVEEDLVGFTGIINKDKFQGVKHLWSGLVQFGAGYRFNQKTSIQLMASLRYGLNPIISNQVFEQTPYAWGIGMQMAKRF